jgi:hypothetical protein
MTISVLRVRGKEGDVSDLLYKLDLEVNSSWCKGEVDRKGVPLSDSGFIVDVADASSVTELIDETRGFLSRCLKLGVSFNGNNLESELSIGLFVGSSDQFTASFDFSIDDLTMLSSLGLSLNVAAYPVSDSDD